jgi:hypothetical protein
MANPFSDDALQRLRDAQSLRLSIIHEVIGEAIPGGNDLERASFLMGALRDVERVELDIAKVNVAKQQEDSAKANSAIMLQLMLNMSKRQNVIQHVSEDDLMLSDEDEVELIDGEDELNYRQIGFDEITSSQEGGV